MLDLNLIRSDPQTVAEGLRRKKADIPLGEILQLDEERRRLQTRLDELRARKNEASQAIGALKARGQDAGPILHEMKIVAQEADELAARLKECERRLNERLLRLPNLPHPDVPDGGPENNRIVAEWGEPRCDAQVEDHTAVGRRWGVFDFQRAAKITGSHFPLFTGAGARLERALIQWMLDCHTKEHGYVEISPPLMVNRTSMTTTGQLPKMKEDMYRCEQDDLYLIPTAEVPVTNLHRDEILDAARLPVKYVAYTPCFRREAGSYGKETRGLVRVHQFDKVELVQFVHPERSGEALEELCGHAQVILQRLGLPYRVVELAAGDLSFAAARCYDLEVYAPGLKRWLEVSSCSNFGDFQARRGRIRFKGTSDGKPRFVHTLNGSGVALARTLIGILEHHQTAGGDVALPEVLRPYLDGRRFLSDLMR